MEQILFSAKQVTSKQKGLFQKGQYLHQIDFELPAGYLMGLIGKNGAGKTTFYDYIMNPKRQYTGTFYLNGEDIHSNHIHTLDQIGFLSEKNQYFSMLSLMENAEMLGRFYQNFDMELFKNTLTEFSLPFGKRICSLSRGEQMKFQLAFGIAHHPKLYLIDEATAGMDPVFRIDFYNKLRHLIADENCSVILSTHLDEEIEQQMDFIGTLENGTLLSFQENIS